MKVHRHGGGQKEGGNPKGGTGREQAVKRMEKKRQFMTRRSIRNGGL
jgi:hypothetical protein